MAVQISFYPIEGSTRSTRDVGYLLEKHPDKEFEARQSELVTMRLKYVHAEDAQTQVRIWADIDPVTLARGSLHIEEYVSDVPFSCSSLFWQGFGKILRSAMTGTTRGDPELVSVLWRVHVCIAGVHTDFGLASEFFVPLGYTVLERPVEDTSIVWIEMEHSGITVQDLTRHLYVLGLALDGRRHHSVTPDTIEKLLRESAGWLLPHPKYVTIAARFMGRQKGMAKAAVDAVEATAVEEPQEESSEVDFEVTESARTPSLAEQRRAAILAVVQARIKQEPEVDRHPLLVELGCGVGRLSQELAQAGYAVLGVDLNKNALSTASRFAKRLRVMGLGFAVSSALHALPPIRINKKGDPVIIPPDSELGEEVERLAPRAKIATEVVEHFQLADLPLFVAALFDKSPELVILTTPNKDYNKVYGMGEDELRDHDHKFEWTRAEFEEWGRRIGALYGYEVEFSGIGPVFSPDETTDPELAAAVPRGSQPSSMAVFTRGATSRTPDAVEAWPSPDRGPAYAPQGLAKSFYVQWEKRTAALLLSRGVVPLPHLPYIPPTMSPGEAAQEGLELERPEDAITYYRDRGVDRVVVEKKHMGSRALVFLAPDGTNVMYTRTGRRFVQEGVDEILAVLRREFTNRAISWALIDGELLPWGAKAKGLIKKSFEPCGAALLARSWLLGDEAAEEDAENFLKVLRHHEGEGQPTQYAPFAVLAGGRHNWLEWTHEEQMELLDNICRSDASGRLASTIWAVLETDRSENRIRNLYTIITRKFSDFGVTGVLDGEGVVVKPWRGPLARDSGGFLAQPGIKVREPEYLRIIYGPQYMRNLDTFRNRGTRSKRWTALQQHSMGLEALRLLQASGGVVTPDIHYWVMAILAVGEDGVDPRL